MDTASLNKKLSNVQSGTLVDPDILLGGTDPDIRLGSQFNTFPSISRLFLRWRGSKVYSQTGWAHGRIYPPHLDLSLEWQHQTFETASNTKSRDVPGSICLPSTR